MGGRDLFWADSNAVKNGIAAPDTRLTIDCLQDLFIPLIPWVDQKPIGLGERGRAQVLRVPLEGRAGAETDPAQNAVDVGVDLLRLPFFHQIFGM